MKFFGMIEPCKRTDCFRCFQDDIFFYALSSYTETAVCSRKDIRIKNCIRSGFFRLYFFCVFQCPANLICIFGNRYRPLLSGMLTKYDFPFAFSVGKILLCPLAGCVFFCHIFFLICFCVFIHFLCQGIIHFLPDSLFVLIMDIIQINFFRKRMILILKQFGCCGSFFFYFPSFLIFHYFFPSFFSFLSQIHKAVITVTIPLRI